MTKRNSPERTLITTLALAALLGVLAAPALAAAPADATTPAALWLQVLDRFGDGLASLAGTVSFGITGGTGDTGAGLDPDGGDPGDTDTESSGTGGTGDSTTTGGSEPTTTSAP